jgi:excisionase family DNA binding protein
VTVRQAAARVGRSEETIRRWIWAGKLPAVKRGHVYYVDVVVLDGLMVTVDLDALPRHQGHSLSEWVAQVRAWKAGLDAPAASRAADLVAEDRWARGDRFLEGLDAGR